MRSTFLTLFFIFSACNCSHGLTSRPVTGEIGRQCSPEPRIVFCDTTVSQQDCEQIAAAIEYINGASGIDLLTFGGQATSDPEAVDRFQAGEVPVVQTTTVEDLKKDGDKILGAQAAQTKSLVDQRNMCIGPAWIELRAVPFPLSEASKQTMFRHELLHLLGISHNETLLTDLMAPAGMANEKSPDPLSDADLNALRAIYGTL